MSALTQGLHNAYLQPKTGTPTLLQERPRPAISDVSAIDESRAVIAASRTRMVLDIWELRASYVFPAGDSVDLFLSTHRALPAVLRDAVAPLKKAFGADSIFRLELSTDEDESNILFGIAVWHGYVRAATQALDRFEEDWWLDHMTRDTVDLAFTYKLA